MKLKLCEEYMQHLGNRIPKTQMRIAREIFITQMQEADKEWADTIKSIADLQVYKSRKESRTVIPEKAEDDLAAWLDDVNLDGDGEINGHKHLVIQSHITHTRLHLNKVALYQCSWCGAPSAVLRKCSRCENVR